MTKWASYHHEMLDGTGYPFGLTGDELTKEDRMMAVIDIYQALTEARPYKEGFSHKKAIGILRELADKGQIDGKIVADADRVFGS